MAYSVILRFDENVGSAIENMWKILSKERIASDCLVPENRPHITLGVYRDDADLEAIRATVRGLACDAKQLPIALSGYGLFPGELSDLWAIPTLTEEIFAIHRKLHTAIASDDLHYAPDHWVPHVTLARALDEQRISAALKALIPIWRPLEGFLVKLEFIRFPSVVVLESYPLALFP